MSAAKSIDIKKSVVDTVLAGLISLIVFGPIVGVVPLSGHLDLKKIAKASGNKKCEMIPLKQLEKTTGYVHGANTPIGIYHSKKFPIFLDESVLNEDGIWVSSGEVGRSVMVNPLDLQKLVKATVADLQE